MKDEECVMGNRFSRTELLFGRERMERLRASRVAVFGLGGVGGYTVEALARSGVGALDLIDDDTICPTNINRQILATQKTVGRYKVDVARERILEINPDAAVNTCALFFTPETSGQFDFTRYDYIVDAIDTVSAKLELAVRAQELGVPIISSMGAGNKVDPTAFVVADIYETSVCPLARVMRRELRRRGVRSLKVVYSTEPALVPPALHPNNCDEVPDDTAVSRRTHCGCSPGARRNDTQRRQVPGSNAFVPSVAGLIAAGEVIKDLTGFIRNSD